MSGPWLIDYEKVRAPLKADNERLRAENAKLRELLEWMDRKGGLGLDVHERIFRALTEKE